VSKYIPRQKTYTLDFKGTEHNGLVVTMEPLSVGEILEVQGSQGDKPSSDNPVFAIFARHIIRWNLARPDGSDVPTTLEGVLEQSADLLTAIVAAWSNAIAGVPAPLDRRSTSGSTSLEDMITTETLSPSLAS
jgi:hypothetical protein